MKKILLFCFFPYLGLSSSLEAMTETKVVVTEFQAAQTDAKSAQVDFSLKALNARFSEILFEHNIFSLKCDDQPFDFGKTVIKTIYIYHGAECIGDVVYVMPKPGVEYPITLGRTLHKFKNNGLGKILALAALADAYQISQCSRVCIQSTTEESMRSLAKFGFIQDGEELPVNFITDKLQEFLITKAPGVLNQAFTKLAEAARNTDSF